MEGTQTTALAARFDQAYHDQGEDGYDDADEGGPLPKLTDDPADLAPFIPADKAAVLSALRLTGAALVRHSLFGEPHAAARAEVRQRRPSPETLQCQTPGVESTPCKRP